jgi:zinc transport system substrate-binding protein
LVVYEKGFQGAVDEAVDTADPEHVVDASKEADLVEVDGQLDPHFWLDPTRMATVADAVRRELAEIDPTHADDYASNFASLERELSRLDQRFADGLASCARRTIVVSHDAFGYLGRRYGLEVLAINGLTPDAEPSPAHIQQLRQLIEKDGITTVFSEELASPELAETLADDLGLTTAVLDPIEGLSDETADQDYLSLMEKNFVALREALDCR